MPGLREDASHDLLIRGGTIYDGSGGAPMRGEVAIDGAAITAVGALGTARGRQGR